MSFVEALTWAEVERAIHVTQVEKEKMLRRFKHDIAKAFHEKFVEFALHPQASVHRLWIYNTAVTNPTMLGKKRQHFVFPFPTAPLEGD